MGICYKTTGWADSLWQSHVKHMPSADNLVDQGQSKQNDFNGFAQDIHGRLYLRNDPPQHDDAPEWATKLHETAQDLSEWHQLRKRCQSDGFSAAMATESLLSSLLELVPQQDPAQQPPPSGQRKANGNGQTPIFGTSDMSQPIATIGQPADDVGECKQGMSAEEKAKLRRQLRAAVCKARDEVDQAKSQMDGFQQMMGMPGTDVAKQPTIEDFKHIRQAYDHIKHNRTLSKIADLAGRMLRTSSTKKRTKVKSGVGAIKGITLSGDVSRVLPSELAGLRGSKIEKLMALQKIEQRKALSYQMQGKAAAKRGPIIVLTDESSSMREGSREVWSKAVALALLNRASKQSRAWHLIGFNGDVTHECHLDAGSKNNMDAVVQALAYGCKGGTDFTKPVTRAFEVLEQEESMRKADVIIITDGDADVSEEVVQKAKELTNKEGVSWFVIGISAEAHNITKSIGQFATSVNFVNATAADEAVDVINLEE